VRISLILLPLSALLIAGCASKKPAVLNGNSVYEMKQSIFALARDLPPGRRDEFERAVETIMLATTDRGLSMSEDRLSPQAMSQLKGRSVGQVIENAKLLRSAAGSL
jgi:hypothetical protein